MIGTWPLRSPRGISTELPAIMTCTICAAIACSYSVNALKWARWNEMSKAWRTNKEENCKTFSSPRCPVIWSTSSWNCKGFDVLPPTLNPDTRTTYLSSPVQINMKHFWGNSNKYRWFRSRCNIKKGTSQMHMQNPVAENFPFCANMTKNIFGATFTKYSIKIKMPKNHSKLNGKAKRSQRNAI